MPRPTKWRRVEFLPEATKFAPAGKPQADLGEVRLKVEELEAMRLKDLEGLSQAECAERMRISRQTFQNIIDAGRRKVTQALTQGLVINIGGGKYTRNVCQYECKSCNGISRMKYELDEQTCVHCGSPDVLCHGRDELCPKGCPRQESSVR